MTTLKQLAETIGIPRFNNLTLSMLAGDEEWIHDEIVDPMDQSKSGNETYANQHFGEQLRDGGITESDFPWQALRDYVNTLENHLVINFIIPLS